MTLPIAHAKLSSLLPLFSSLQPDPNFHSFLSQPPFFSFLGRDVSSHSLPLPNRLDDDAIWFHKAISNANANAVAVFTSQHVIRRSLRVIGQRGDKDRSNTKKDSKDSIRKGYRDTRSKSKAHSKNEERSRKRDEDDRRSNRTSSKSTTMKKPEAVAVSTNIETRTERKTTATVTTPLCRSRLEEDGGFVSEAKLPCWRCYKLGQRCMVNDAYPRCSACTIARKTCNANDIRMFVLCSPLPFFSPFFQFVQDLH